MRFVPVPYQALDLVQPDQVWAVVCLYRTGHTLRWAPFKVTVASLVTTWGISRRAVWDVLEALAEAGLLELTKGSYRTPSTVRVLDPSVNGRSPPDRYVDHTADRSVDHNEQAPTPDTEESGPLSGPLAGPPSGRTLMNLNEEPDPDLETAAAAPGWDALAEWWGALPGRKAPTPTEPNGVHLAELLAGCGGDVDAALTVLRWWREGDGLAAYLRRKGYALRTLAAHVATYRDLAGAWAAERPSVDADRPNGPTGDADAAWWVTGDHATGWTLVRDGEPYAGCPAGIAVDQVHAVLDALHVPEHARGLINLMTQERP